MKFSEYLLKRDEEMAFYVLEQSLQNEGLLRGIKGIWNMARGGKYNQDDAKSAMNTANVIANMPDIAQAGKGIFDLIRNLGVGAAATFGGGDMQHQAPREPVPMVRAYTPPSVEKGHRRREDGEDNASYDIFRNAKGARDYLKDIKGDFMDPDREAEREEMRINRFARAQAFANIDRKRKDFSLDFIDQTPSA
jgi:hypothetical protein